MEKDTVDGNNAALNAVQIRKIKQAEAEIRLLARYFKIVPNSDKTVLEKYLEDLQRHPAINNASHKDYERLNEKIEYVRYNLNLTEKPSYYPKHQRSFTDLYNAAQTILKENTGTESRTQNSKATTKTAKPARLRNLLPTVATQEFADSTPAISLSSKSVTKGETITCTLNADYQGVTYFWLFGDYNSGEKQTSKRRQLVIDTSKLTTGKQYRVRATLSNTQRVQKRVQAIFSITQRHTSASSQRGEPRIIPQNPSVRLGQKITFTVDCAGTDIAHYYWIAGNQRQGGVPKLEVDTTSLKQGTHRVRVSVTFKSNNQTPMLLTTRFTVDAKPQSQPKTLPDVNNAEIVLKQQQKHIQAACQFKEMNSAYFSWMIDSFTNTFKQTDNGINKPAVDIKNLKKGSYRIRISISYQRRTRRLEKRFTIDGNVLSNPSQEAKNTATNNNKQSSLSVFIEKTAAVFARSKSQDSAHNPILNYLLLGDYAEKNVNSSDSKAAAYRAVRGGIGKTSHPLYWIRSREQLAKVQNSDFFIRDFMQLQGAGGESKSTPFVVGDAYSTGSQRYGLVIQDGVIHSKFANDFNKIAEKINQTPQVKKIPQDVEPYTRIAHRDGIQLIPISRNVSQLAGMTMRHVLINGNTLSSEAALQGVFASDGTFQDLRITNNSLDVGGTHTISINGMLSGKIENNTDLKNRQLPKEKITLYPLRIGGGANIYVMSFKNPRGLKAGDQGYYAYEEIKGSQAITDLRNVKPNKYGATYWKNVDLPRLQARFTNTFAKVRLMMKARSTRQEINDVWNDMMMQVGELDK